MASRIPVKVPDWGSYVAETSSYISNVTGGTPAEALPNAGFGPGLNMLAAAFKKRLGKALTEREKKDLESGRAAALEHLHELRNNASDWLRKIEKEGLVANWNRPDVREGYKTMAGMLYGSSPQVKAALNEGMQPFVMEMVEQGVSSEEFNAAYDTRMKGVTKGLVEQEPDVMSNRFFKDLGFLPEITKEMERSRDKWTKIWEAAGTAKHQETTKAFLGNLMDAGEWEQSSEWFHSGVLEDDPKGLVNIPGGSTYKGVAPLKLWSREEKPKLAFFTSVKDSLLGPAYAGRADSPYRVQNLERTLLHLDWVRSIRPSNLGTRLDSGEMKGHYNLLEGNLVKDLMAARNSASGRVAAAEDGFAGKVGAPFSMRFQNMDDVESSAAAPTYMYLGKEMERKKGVFDGVGAAEYLERLYSNRILIPSTTGELEPLIWDISKIPEDQRAAELAKGWTPTPAELEAGNKYLAYATIRKLVAAREALRQGEMGEAREQRKLAVDDFEERFEGAQQIAAVLFGKKTGKKRKGGMFETWDDDVVNSAMQGVLASFQEEADLHGYPIDYTKANNDFREWAGKNFQETYTPTKQISNENNALSRLLADNTGVDEEPFWLNAGQGEIEYTITTMYPSLTREGRIRLSKMLFGRGKSWGSLNSFESGTRGLHYSKELLKHSLLEINSPALAAYFVQREGVEKKGVIPNALQAPTYSRAETTYRTALEDFVRIHWREVLKEIGENNNNSAAAIPTSFLEKLMTQATGKVELSSFNPITKEVFKKEYEQTLLNKWLISGKGAERPDGSYEYPNGWVERLRKADAVFDTKVQRPRKRK